MKGKEHCVVITEECGVNSEALIGSTERLTLQTRYCINLCRYKRVRLYLHSD